MTFREKLMHESPALVDDDYAGGCYSCPYRYGFEAERPAFCNSADPDLCRVCWNRECLELGGAGELRPCEVDGQRCYFHRFIEEERGVLQINIFMKERDAYEAREIYERYGLVFNGCSLEKLRHAYALVEFSDGTVKKVEPEKVRFLDREG